MRFFSKSFFVKSSFINIRYPKARWGNERYFLESEIFKTWYDACRIGGTSLFFRFYMSHNYSFADMKPNNRLAINQLYASGLPMKRRSFLQTLAGGGAAALGISSQTLGGMPLLAMSPDKFGAEAQNSDNILIIIQLFGGNDGLNTIIPVDDAAYYRLRPRLAVPKQQATRLFGSRVYLHPALSAGVPYGGFEQLYEDGRLAIVQGVGYENPNLSHFRSTDIWLSGINSSAPGAEFNDGWVGRSIARLFAPVSSSGDALPDYPLCVQIGGTLSLLLKDERRGDMGIAISDPERFFQLGQDLAPDEAPMTDGSAFADEFNYVRLIAQKSSAYSLLVKDAFDRGRNAVDYAEGFPQQLRMAARLISGGLRTKVFLAYLGGFDTHVLQQREDGGGLHPRLLSTLATGISQFMRDASEQGFADRVVGMTISEFGRRPQENGSLGTDHGAASVQFVFGNKVNGNVFGAPFDLENLNANGDLQYQYDYRRVYANVLQAWFGATQEETSVILGERIAPLPVIQSRTTRANAFASLATGGESSRVRVSPNPSRGVSTVSFELRAAAEVEITLFGAEGRERKRVWKGFLNAGAHRFPLEIFENGSFICLVRAGDAVETVPIVVVR
jgi:uncharacterized protein (DUF1501 family)